jgi:hypothetical protein
VDETPRRRRFLQVASAGTALTLAGCNAFQSSDESPTTGDDSDGDADDGGDGTDASRSGDGGAGATDGGETTVTVAVQPDQEAMQERQAEIQSALRDGNMSQQEAQQALQQAQVELVGEVVDAYRERVADRGGITVENALPRFGVLKVTGTPAALLGTLSAPEVNALLDEETFADAQERADAAGGSGTQTPE